VLEGAILGKPADAGEARRMLRSLSGRTHVVLTAVHARAAPPHGGAPVEGSEMVSTAVRFRPLTDRVIDWYVATGEPLDKAGAYAVQGIGGALVHGVAGSVSNVVGLPLAETLALLERLGLPAPWERREP
jgi:septum formation protein